MTPQTVPLNELTRQAIAVLTRELGVVGTVRFLSQFSSGRGDYTAERDALLEGMTFEELVAEAQRIDEQRGQE